MEIHRLAVFVEIARARSIEEAARTLEMPPASVERYLARMQTTLGVNLFSRDRRRIKLTTSGQAFLPYAQRCVRLLERGRRVVQRSPSDWRLAIGATDSLAPLVLPPILSRLLQTPAQIVCSTDHSALLVQKLLDRVLHVAFVVASAVPPIIHLRVLRRVPIVCVTTPRSSLTRAFRYRIADLLRAPLAVYRWNPDTDVVANFLERKGLKVPQLRQVAPLSTARALIMAQDCACFLPASAVADDLATGRLVRLQIRDVPRWTWDISVAHHSKLRSSAIGIFLLRTIDGISWRKELA